MTIMELLSMMRLLAALESAVLTARTSVPDHIYEDVAHHIEILERELLERAGSAR